MRYAVGGLREAAQPLVDVADEGVDLTVTRSARRGDERHVEGLIQTAGGGERAGDAEARTRRLRFLREAIPIRAIGFVEQSCRPERVAVERDGFRIVGRDLPERLGFAPGPTELGDLQRGADAPFAGTNGNERVVGPGRLIEGQQRFLVSGLVVEERGELELKIGVGVRGPANDQRGSDEQRDCHDRGPSSTWQPSKRPHGPTLAGTWAPPNPP